MTRRGRLRLWLTAGAFVLGLVATLLMIRNPSEPFTRAVFEAARQRWRESGIEDYHMRYRMNGSDYVVTVRDGIVTDVTVDGREPHTTNLQTYGMDGLMDVLALELENLQDANGPFGDQAKTIIARVHFHPKLGYVERYLRSSGGMGRGAAVELLEFTAGKRP